MSNVTTVEPGGAPEIEVGAPPGNHFGLERDRRGCAAGRISDGTTVRLPSDLPSRGGLGLIGGQRVQSRDARLACRAGRLLEGRHDEGECFHVRSEQGLHADPG